MSAPAEVLGGATAPSTMPRATVGALVVASGALMLAAGYTFAGDGWASARPFAIGGGLTIQLALFLERRDVRRRAGRTRHGRAWLLRLGASGLIAVSGAGLAFVGHSAATGGWWPAGTAVIPLLAPAAAAAALNRAAAEIRSSRRRNDGDGGHARRLAHDG